MNLFFSTISFIVHSLCPVQPLPDWGACLEKSGIISRRSAAKKARSQARTKFHIKYHVATQSTHLLAVGTLNWFVFIWFTSPRKVDGKKCGPLSFSQSSLRGSVSLRANNGRMELKAAAANDWPVGGKEDQRHLKPKAISLRNWIRSTGCLF